MSPNLVTLLQTTVKDSLVLTGKELDPDVYMVRFATSFCP